MFRFILTVVTAFAVLAGCSGKPEATASSVMAEADTLRHNKQFQQALTLLDEIPVKFPADSAAQVKAWVTAADICGGDLHNFDKSIEYHQKIMDRFPGNDQAPKSLLIVALTYEQQLQNTERARQLYEEFLKKYPDHEIAESVRANLALLDLSEEELNKRLEKAGEIK